MNRLPRWGRLTFYISDPGSRMQQLELLPTPLKATILAAAFIIVAVIVVLADHR